jgi:hypothetical protein
LPIKDWSITPSLNTALGTLFTGPNMARGDVDNAIRQLMADVRSKFAEQPISVKDHDATGDGVTDDSTAVLDALVEGRDAGSTVFLPAGTYNISPNPSRTMGGTFVHPATTGALLLPPGVSFDGQAATIKASLHKGFVGHGEYNRTDAVTDVSLNSGAKTFTIGSAADNWAVGDIYLARLGDLSFDLPETRNWVFGRVVSKTATTITGDRGMSFSWNGTGTYNTHVRQMVISEGRRISNIRVEGVGHHTNGLFFERSPYLDHVFVKDAEVGFTFQYVEGFHVNRMTLVDRQSTAANDGQGLRIAEGSGYLGHLETRNRWNEAVIAEGGSDLIIGYHHDIDTRDAQGRVLVVASGGSRIHIERGVYKGCGGYHSHELGAADAPSKNWISWGCARFELDGREGGATVNYEPLTLPVPGVNVRELSLSINGTEELYLASKVYEWEQTVWLDDNRTVTLRGPSGCVVSCQVLLGGGAVRSDLSALNIGRDTSVTDALSYVPTTASTYWNDASSVYGLSNTAWGGIFGDRSWGKRTEQVKVDVITPAGSALRGAGKFVRVRMLICRDEYRALSADSSVSADDLVRGDGTMTLSPRTVANLPAASLAYAGWRSFVSNATATTFGSTVAGGGSNYVPVWCDGSAWKIG